MIPCQCKRQGEKNLGKRGATPFEEKIGEDKFKELLNRYSISNIAKLYCEHFIEDKDKVKCHACKVTIYRAKARIEKKDRAKKRYDPIEDFEAIPEIQSFIDYQKSKGAKHKNWLRLLRQYWIWIKEDPSLTTLQRPALWDQRHIKFILKNVRKQEIALYGPKQALRRFFESQENYPMQKNVLIKAKRADMRSPKGPKRKVMSFRPSELTEILVCVSSRNQLLIKVHVTVKSREQSLLETEWSAINWQDPFYGFPMATITIFEPKTKGGTYWEHCPLDLWFNDLSKDLYEEWERQGKPKQGKIFPMSYHSYFKLWQAISKILGRKFEPHDCRRSAGGWLRDLGISDLALGQYNPLTGKAIGYTGVGWENSEIYYQRYGKRNPVAIYDKTQRLDIATFDGLIHKILENK